MELTKSSCEGFLESLASKAPAPGGGGAAALVGAAGVALGNMVGSLTVGKKKYAAVEADLRTLNARAEALRRRLEALVQADAEAFLPLAAAYGLPKETPEQQAHKAAVLEQALDGLRDRFGPDAVAAAGVLGSDLGLMENKARPRAEEEEPDP